MRVTGEQARRVETLSQFYVALLSAQAEVGARALRAAAAESAEMAQLGADTLRAPPDRRMEAGERLLRGALDSHLRTLRALRGAGAYWQMSALYRFDASRRR